MGGIKKRMVWEREERREEEEKKKKKEEEGAGDHAIPIGKEGTNPEP